MSLMRWNSVRVRLILWNVAVLALVLGGFGTALCYRVQAEMQASVDHELASRRRFPPPGPGPRGRSGVRVFRWEERGRGEHRGPLGPGGAPPPVPGSRLKVESSGLSDASTFSLQPSNPERAADPSGRRRDPADPFARLNEELDDETRRRLYFRGPRHLTPDGRPWILPAWDPATVALAAAGREVYSTVRIDGEPVRVFSAPLFQEAGHVAAVIQFAHPMTEQRRLIEGQMRTLVTLIPLALLVAGAGGIFLTDRALRPVRRITQAAAEIGAADLSRRLEVTGQDEFAELATTFNGMIARLDEAFQRLENAYQRLEGAFEQQRRFTADASHELRTPLTRIKASVSLALSEQRDAAAYRKALQVVDDAANAMSRLIQDLLLLARVDAAQLRLDLQPLPVVELLEDAAAAVPAESGCPITFRLPDEPLEVLGDRDALERLLANLIGNALRHTPRDGQITLAAHREAESVVISVEDTGEGIPPEHLPHVCDRFYRVDEARSRAAGGTGLGLAICRSIAEAHGGTLTIDSVVGQGTTVRVTLPRAAGGAPAAPEAEAVGSRSGGSCPGTAAPGPGPGSR